MKHFVHLCCLLLASGWLLTGPVALAQAPSWQNAQALVATAPAGSPANAFVTAQATDAAGNLYVAGGFNDVLQLGTTTLTSTSSARCFIAKYSRVTNSFVWAQLLGGNSAQAIAVSGATIYVAGLYRTTASFGTTTLAPFGTALNTNDIFVAKLTDMGSSASYVWAQRAGGTNDDYLFSLALSGTSVFIAGTFKSATAQFGNTTLTNANAGFPVTSDAFVAKLTDAGTLSGFSWAQRAGGFADDYATAIAVSGNSVYIAGGAAAIASFGNLTLSSAGMLDAYVAKLTDAGNTSSYTWVQQFGGADDDQVGALALGSTGLYVAGGFASASLSVGTTTLTNTAVGKADGFVAKLTDAGTTGNYVWARQLGGPNDDAASTLATQGNNVYVGGYFNRFLNGGSGTGSCTIGSTVLQAVGKADLFVARLVDAGASGNYSWAQQAGGTDDDGPTALSLSGNSLYVLGYSFSAAPSFGTFTLTNPSASAGGVISFLSSLTDTTLPTRDAALQTGLGLYPNPAHATATVHVPTGPATITLLDALGRVAHTQVVTAAGDYQLDLTGLFPSIYILRVQTSDALAGSKLVVK